MKKRKKETAKAQGRRAAVMRRRRATAPAVHPACSSAAQEGWRFSSPLASTWGSCQRWGPPRSPPQHPLLLHPAPWDCLASRCSASWPNWSCANAAVTWPWKVSSPVRPLPIAVPPPRCLPGILSMVHATQRSCSGGAAACVQGCAGQSACRAAEEGLCARSQCAFTAQGRVNAVLAVQGFVCLHGAALHARAVPAHSAALRSYCRAGPCACFRCRACVCIICIFAVQGFFARLQCLQLGALCVFESRLCCAGLRVPFARGELQQHGAQQQGPAHSPGPSLGLCSSAGSRQAPGFPPSSASPGNPRGPCREGPGISPAPLQRAGGRGAPHARCWLYLAIGLCVCVWGPWSPHGSPSHRWSSGWGASLRPSPPWPWLCTPMSSSLAVPMHPSLQRSGDTLRPLCHPRALWMCCGSVCMQHPVPHSPLCALHAPRSASLWECSLSPPMGAAPTCVIGATPVQRALRWDRGVLVHPR